MATTRGWGQLGCLLLVLTVKQISSMNNCNTQSAICTFHGGKLEGTILFNENHGFGCSSFGNGNGLHMQVDLQGFDPKDVYTSHTFRVKSYAGLMPDCGGMGPDYGRGLQGSDLGTYAEGDGGVIQINDVRLQNGPTIVGQQSILGRSIAVLKGSQDRFQRSPPEVLGCCIIGVANLQQPRSNNVNNFNSNNNFNNNNNNNNFNNNPFGNRGGSSFGANSGGLNSNQGGFGSSAGPSSSFDPFGSATIGRQSAPSSRPSPSSLAGSFTTSAFRKPFDLKDKFEFFDLSGKTSRVNDVLPDNIEKNFKAPEPPRFQDIYGLDNGDSPLGRSGYGNTVRPNKGSKLSDMFFKDADIKVTERLTPGEMTIPREATDEETSRSFHEDRAVEKDPGYDSPINERPSEGSFENSDPYSDQAGDSPSLSNPQPDGSLPSEYGNTDLGQASFLPTGGASYDDNSLENIDVSTNIKKHNGREVPADATGPDPALATGGDSATSDVSYPDPSAVPSPGDTYSSNTADSAGPGAYPGGEGSPGDVPPEASNPSGDYQPAPASLAGTGNQGDSYDAPVGVDLPPP